MAMFMCSCPFCGNIDLEDKGSTVRCGNCSSTWYWEDLSPKEVASLLPSTVRKIAREAMKNKTN